MLHVEQQAIEVRRRPIHYIVSVCRFGPFFSLANIKPDEIRVRAATTAIDPMSPESFASSINFVYHSMADEDRGDP